jgi:predicted RNase H-like HicB family nuclease
MGSEEEEAMQKKPRPFDRARSSRFSLTLCSGRTITLTCPGGCHKEQLSGVDMRSFPGASGVSRSAIVSSMQALDLMILYEDGDEGWIVASIPAVPGVLSQGRDRDEARGNVLDALALMFSPEPIEAGDERERELLHLTVS